MRQIPKGQQLKNVRYPVPVWPDLALFRRFGKNLKALGKFVRAHLVFDKFWIYFGNFYPIGQTFIAAND